MCETYENIKAMKETIYKIENDKNRLTRVLNRLEKAQQDLLHIIENEEKVNVVRMRDIYNSLRDIRRERRKVKNELLLIEEVQPMAKRLKPQIIGFCNKAENKENTLETISSNKTYKNRIMQSNTDISKEIYRIIQEGK